jgi:hypothetical protein
MEKWLAAFQKQQGQPQPSKGKGKGKGSKGPKEKRRRVQGAESQALLLAAILAVGDLAAETARSDRVLRGALMRTELSEPAALHEQPLNISDNTQGTDQQNQATCAAVVAALSTTPPSEHTTAAIDALKAHTANPCAGWQTSVSHCRLAETHDREKLKLQLWVKPQLDEDGKDITRILVAGGAELKYGAPPKSAKERKTLQMLTELRAMT